MLSQSSMELFSELIATPSASCADPRYDQGNRRVAELLGSRLEALGFTIEFTSLPGDGTKVNLLARRGGADEAALALCGHLDTVPCDPDAWSVDPYRLEQKDGRFYGLGTCDMKGFFAVLVEALGGLELERLRRPLCVLGTANEECDMAGARLLSTRPARYALIGEPTGLTPVIGHKGILMEQVRLTGRSAHASNPGAGVSALEGMCEVMAALRAWRTELQRQSDSAYAVPTPTLNLGSIHGGDSANRVCGACELSVDLRLLPGMEPGALRAELRRRVAQAVAGSGLELECVALFDGQPAMQTPPGAPIVRLAEELSGRPAACVNFATEGGYLNALGASTIILGPGDIRRAHSADEYLEAAQVAPMVGILRGLVERLCMVEETPA